MNIFIPGSSIFKTYFPPLKSAEIGCVTGGSGAPDYYESRFLVVEASWMPFLFREKIGHLLPRHSHKISMSFHFRKTTNISTRLLEFRQERQDISKRNEKIRCDPLHLNTELFSFSLSSSSTHSYVEGIPNEGVARSDREFVVPLDHLQLPDSVTLSLSSIIACCVISTAVPVERDASISRDRERLEKAAHVPIRQFYRGEQIKPANGSHSSSFSSISLPLPSRRIQPNLEEGN